MTESDLCLTKASIGQRLRVERLNMTEEDALRLKRLGVCVGRAVQLVQVGDPLIVVSVGSRIGVSRRLAANIVVSPV